MVSDKQGVTTISSVQGISMQSDLTAMMSAFNKKTGIVVRQKYCNIKNLNLSLNYLFA